VSVELTGLHSNFGRPAVLLTKHQNNFNFNRLDILKCCNPTSSPNKTTFLLVRLKANDARFLRASFISLLMKVHLIKKQTIEDYKTAYPNSRIYFDEFLEKLRLAG
jgi:hypothetical protein